VVNRFYEAVYKTNNINIVTHCQHAFNFNVPSDTVARRVKKWNSM